MYPLLTARAVDNNRTIFQDITGTNSITNDIKPAENILVGNYGCQLTG